MPSTLPNNLFSAAAVRAMDQSAMADHGLGDGLLMERAGQAAFQALQTRWPQARRVAVVTGSGNNGGDGYVIARLAQAAGLSVGVFAVRAAKHTDARRAAGRYQAAGGDIRDIQTLSAFQPDVIVDALMGTGLARALQGDFAQAVERINASQAPCLAVDIPTGIHADTGAVMGCAVKATATLTFVALKAGLVTGRAPAFTGTLSHAGLGVPDAVYQAHAPTAQRITDAAACAALPPRERDAHKGRFGHILCLGGDYGFGGAISLAAQASLRAGAGRVSVYTRAEHIAPILAARPEIMCHGERHRDSLIAQADVIALGPGLGQADFGRALWQAALESDKPLVVDADALNLLAQHPKPPQPRGHWILTPHPGEAARLLDTTTAAIAADRYAAADALCRRYHATVVLKGAGTIVAAPEEPFAVIRHGNPGMATAGMGDVLTGIIAALWGQHLGNAYTTACLATHLHARAADDAAQQGERGLLARDVIHALRHVVNPQQF